MKSVQQTDRQTNVQTKHHRHSIYKRHIYRDLQTLDRHKCKPANKVLDKIKQMYRLTDRHVDRQ